MPATDSIAIVRVFLLLMNDYLDQKNDLHFI
jgi:hypothetical protein